MARRNDDDSEPMDDAEDHGLEAHLNRPQSRIDVIRAFVQNSPWVVISVAAHLAVIGVLGMYYVGSQKAAVEAPPVVMNLKQAKEADEPPPPPEEKLDRKAIPENQDAEVVTFDENVFTPQAEVDPDLTQPRGDPTAIANTSGFTGGTSMGVGAGGHFGTGRPSAFAGRLGGGKKGRVGGPTQATEEAVLNGLRWLLRHQNDDGSWTTRCCAEKCGQDGHCFTSEDDRSDRLDEGLTGLALLCFLGSGYTHESKQYIVDPVTAKKYRLGEVVKKGLQYLTDRQQPDGSFSAAGTFMYNEAIATLALCEAYGLTKNRYWKAPAQKAVDFLAGAQRPAPGDVSKRWGWRYDTRKFVEDRRSDYATDAKFNEALNDSDTSVTGWVVMALKSAELSGLNVPPECREGAIAFTKQMSQPSGLSGYQRQDQATQKLTGPNDQYKYYIGCSMGAVNMCIRIFLEHNPDDPYLVAAADQLIKPENLPASSDDGLSVDYYYWYYATLALNQVDGPDSPKKTNRHWNAWNTAMNKVLLGMQDKTEKNCSMGGWMARDRWSYEASRIYTTAINILTLEVYYRYENAFGSSAREKKAPKAEAPKAEPEKKESEKK